MLIIYVTNPIWLTITFIFNFFTIIIILRERRKAEISPANQDRKANLIHATKRATNFIKSQLMAIYLKTRSMPYILYSLY